MPEREVLEAVVFDAGGTLVRLDFEWMSAAVTALGHPLDAGAMRRGEVEGRRRFDAAHRTRLAGGTYDDWAGAADTRAYFGGMLEAAGVPGALVPAALARFFERHAGPPGLWSRPVEGARQAMDALRAAGLRIACVSNSDGRAAEHLAAGGVREGLEFVVDSGIEGVEKPDPRIFHIALDRLGLPAGRALYVGDLLSVDGLGSRAAGMHFVLIDPYGDYAANGTHRVAEIAALPDWVQRRFTVPGGD